MLERWVVTDEDGDGGSVTACSRLHAQEVANDLGQKLGESQGDDGLDELSFCCLCGNDGTEPTEAETVPVFVYGTLKTGRGNDRLIEDMRESVEHGTVSGLRLLDLGSFPGAVPAEGSKVRGEFLTLSDPAEALARLDRLEGHPNFYRRTWVEVALDGGRKVEGWTYVLQRTHREDRGRDVTTGDDGADVWEPTYQRHRWF